MSNQQQGPGRDPDLGKAAADLGAAWSKLEQEEPSDLLDQAILNAARRDLERPTRRVRRGWLAALATAAVVVLALAITVQQDQQGPVPPVSRTDGFRLEQSTQPSTDTEAAARAVPTERSPARVQAPSALPAPSADPAAAQRDADAPQPLAESVEEDIALPEPEVWLERLLQLHRAGRQSELEVELAAFRKAYPEYPLPRELLD